MDFMSVTIGFIGQGFIGKSYADDFESRGYEVVRYSLEPAYVKNKDKISKCDYVFIAVPTPTKNGEFDMSIVEGALRLVGTGKTAVVKSTLLPGTTKNLQKAFPKISVLHSPEFLNARTAAYDAANPKRNIVGITKDTPAQRKAAAAIIKLLPKASFDLVCDSTEAELIKYARNGVGYFRIIFYNILHDLASTFDANWDPIRQAIAADPENGPEYTRPVDQGGRGAGGVCFIKDMAALRGHYEMYCKDDAIGIDVLKAMEKKNIHLLTSTGKDLDLLRGVYGSDAVAAVAPISQKKAASKKKTKTR